jgi:uncharacterized protein (TIGR00369 family)
VHGITKYLGQEVQIIWSMSYLEKVRREGRDANPFFVLMGIDVQEAGTGRAVLRMPVRPDMMNGEGWLQGGIYCALADEAMVLAVYPLLSPGDTIATITETTTFLGGTREGVLFGLGRVVRKGSRVIFAEGEVRSESPEGPVLSRSIATFIVNRARVQ